MKGSRRSMCRISRSGCAALCSLFAFSCANDVVLGEHVATRAETTDESTAATTNTAEPSEVFPSSTATQTSAPGASKDDKCRPHGNDKDDGDYNEDWPGDAAFPDGAFADAGPWPQFPPERMDESGPFDPRPMNSVEPRPCDPLNGTTGGFEELTGFVDSQNEDSSN